MKTSFTVSVMHTGTTFTQQLLNRSTLGSIHSHQPIAPRDLFRLVTVDVVVIPLRDPRRVWQSWWERIQGREQLFYDSWAHLYAYSRMCYRSRMCLLPVDAIYVRDAYLRKLSDALSEPLVTDWEPKGVWSGDRCETPPPPMDWSRVFWSCPILRMVYSEE